MARLRWVQAMLREWAAWIEGFGGGLHSPELDGMPRGNVDRLDPEYQAVLALVYIEGPRANKVKLSEIARWKEVNERTFLDRVEVAERKFSEELDFIENFSSEGE